MSCFAISASCMMRRAWIRKARPASVSVTCFWLRSISVSPSSASRALMAFVTEGCETCSTFAVRVKFSSSLIVQKYSNCRNSIVIPPFWQTILSFSSIPKSLWSGERLRRAARVPASADSRGRSTRRGSRLPSRAPRATRCAAGRGTSARGSYQCCGRCSNPRESCPASGR